MLDLDTGFTKDFILANKDIHAGLEYQGLGGDLPYVLKNPKLMWRLPELLKETPVVIDHILIPIREIHAAAESRRGNLQKAHQAGELLSPQHVVGGLEGVDDAAMQEAFFLEKFYCFFEFVSAYNIPVTLLHYPRLVYDSAYLYQKLLFLVGEKKQVFFEQVFNGVCDQSLVHKYTEGDRYYPCYDDGENINQQQAWAEITEGSLFEAQAKLKELVTSKEQIRRENQTLRQRNELLHKENQAYIAENRRLRGSRSWRYTRPCRLLMAMSRGDIQYLYDAVQKLRNWVCIFRQRLKGRSPRFSRYFIEPVFQFIKRLFKPLLRRVFYALMSHSNMPVNYGCAVQYRSDYEENFDFSQYETDIKAIAFYLPQFHQIPENDQWWGEGFTEWTNMQKAKPLFQGHYQPRIPHFDIGYYDLSDTNVLKAQALLARQHGIYGFCFYHYYFNGKRLLEKPVDMLLEHPEIDINFCLCWANENWTKKWDGAEHEVLIAQEYSPKDDIDFMKDLIRYMKDPRYIKVNGKPVVMIYRPLLLPDPKETFSRWRQYCRERGIGEVAIWMVRGCFNLETALGLEDVTDAEVEFPPHFTVPLQWISPNRFRHNKLKTPLVDYKAMVNSIMTGNTVADKSAFPIYRTVMLGWDDTPRRNEQGRVFYGFSTHLYFKWLRYNIQQTCTKFPADERFVFINAWNEWAEGTYLEPDEKYGYANINAASKAIFDLPFAYKPVKKSEARRPSKQLELADLTAVKPQSSDPGSIAVHAHVFHTDLIHELIHYMNHIPFDYDCYITTDTEGKKQEIADAIQSRLNAAHTEIRITPNVGRDVAPFLVGCRDLVNTYDYICHIHTKKSAHGTFGDYWRDHLLDYLLGSEKLVAGILDFFLNNDHVGMIYPPFFTPVKSMAVWGANKDRAVELLKKVGIDRDLPENPVFPGGTMMWLRAKAFKDLFDAGFEYNHFEKEQGQLDGTLAHAFERSFVYIAEHHGYICLSLVN